MRSELRGPLKAPLDAKYNMENLAKHFAKTALSKHKQNVTILIVGAMGTGKSYAALQLGYSCARWIARLRHQGEDWTKFFGTDPIHLAVIDQDTIVKSIMESQKYGVHIRDDIGVGWNARNFAKEENKMMNDILELVRIDNTIQILTVMDQFLIDKVPRTIIPYYATMNLQNPVFMDWGLTMMKVHRLVRLFREGKTLYPYPVSGRSKFVEYRVQKAPAMLTEAYDKIRAENTQKIKVDRLTKYQTIQEEKVKRVERNDEKSQYRTRMNDAINSVIHGEMRLKDAAAQYKVTYATLANRCTGERAKLPSSSS